MANSKIKAIIFDYGNVLLEWDPRLVYKKHFSNDPEAIDRFFKEVDFIGWNAKQDKGRPFKEGVADLSSQFPYHAHLIQAYHDHWTDSIGNAYWDTVEIVRELKVLGYPLFGLSNWSAETFPSMREKFEFFDLFDDMVISGEVGHIKPEPEIYHIILKMIGRPSQECLFVDDSLPNINQANTMGFETIHYRNSTQLRSELKQLGILNSKGD